MRVRWFAALFLLLLVGSGCKVMLGPSAGEQLLHKGLRLAEQGKYEEATQAFKDAAHTGAGWSAWNNVGVCQARLGRHLEAVKAYTRALKSRPDSTVVLFNRGVAYLRVKQHAEAIRDFQTLLKKRNRFAPAWNNLGVAFLAKWKHIDAFRAFQKALKYRQAYLAAWNNLAAAYWYLGRYDLARHAVQKALAINASSPAALKNAQLLKHTAPAGVPPAKKRRPPKKKPDTVITDPGLAR